MGSVYRDMVLCRNVWILVHHLCTVSNSSSLNLNFMNPSLTD